jgi:hypothetical protein
MHAEFKAGGLRRFALTTRPDLDRTHYVREQIAVYTKS